MNEKQRSKMTKTTSGTKANNDSDVFVPSLQPEDMPVIVQPNFSYLAALVFSRHVVQHCCIINEGIQFAADKKKSQITFEEFKIRDQELDDKGENEQHRKKLLQQRKKKSSTMFIKEN